MATESVAEAWPEGFGPKALAAYDSGVYMAWIKAIGDVMMNAGRDSMPPKTTANLGGLILALSEAAEEVDERDRQQRRGEG